MREYSDVQNYAWDFIQRVGCASVQQMDYVLHHKFDVTTGQVINVLHSLEQDFLVHVDDNSTYVLNGTKDAKFSAKFDIKMIQALQVALDIIGKEEPKDYDYIYKCNSGTELRFYTRGTSFNVYVANLENASFIRYIDEKGKEQYDEDEKHLGEERAIELAEKFIIVFPHDVNKKEALKLIKGLNMFMPTTLAFITGDEYFLKQQIEYIN